MCALSRGIRSEDCTSDSIVALLVFDGPELQGFLQLFLLEDCADPIALYDAGELVNQVAGRFSNRLYNCGFNIRTSTSRIVRSGAFEAQRDMSDLKYLLPLVLKKGGGSRLSLVP